MQIEQISVFMENKSGQLAQVTAVLNEAKIKVKAMILADLSDFGVLRMIVDNAGQAQDHLRHQGFVVKSHPVFSLEFKDGSDEFQKILESLNQAGINVEYMYAFAGTETGRTNIVFMVDNPQKAAELI